MEFSDDGGTPAYRTRMAAPSNSLAARIKRLTFLQIVLVVVFCAVAPWIVLFGGLVVLGVIDALS